MELSHGIGEPAQCVGGCGSCRSRCHRVYQGQMRREEALDQLYREAEFELGREQLPLHSALGRVSAEEVRAAWNVPPAACASHDGAAFRWACVSTSGVLEAGQYTLLGMGRPLPKEYDTLAPYELFRLDGKGRIQFSKIPSRGSGISPAGGTVQAGDPVIRENVALEPSHLALLRSVGAECVTVWKRPRAAILPMGKDIAPLGQAPGPGQFADGDSLLFQLMVEGLGGTADILPVQSGGTDRLAEALSSLARQYDLLLLAGGTGNGGEDYGDFAPSAVARAGTVITHGISLRPGGKATLIAAVERTPVIAFPGPMHAALLMAEQLLPPVLGRFLHQRERERIVVAKSGSAFPKRDGDAMFFPHVLVSETPEGYAVSAIRMGDGPDTFVRANGVALLEPGRDYLPGEMIRVRLLERFSAWGRF